MPTASNFTFSPIEKEILILQACATSINSLVSERLFEIQEFDNESVVLFHDDIQQKFFYITLVDFLSNSHLISVNKLILDALVDVCLSPQLNSASDQLKDDVAAFQSWLDRKVVLSHEISFLPDYGRGFEVLRKEIILICGNMAKHNLLGLTIQGKKLIQIYARSGHTLDLHGSVLVLPEFYEYFHDNVLNYHAPTIIELLNNIRWSLYEYILPTMDKWNQVLWERKHASDVELAYPNGVDDRFIKDIFIQLTRQAGDVPTVRRFQTHPVFKKRY